MKLLCSVDAGSYGDKKDKKETRPFFKAYAVLTIPNVNMSPALDEVQQTVNKAAQMVISVSKGVSKWHKGLQPQDTMMSNMERRPSIGSVGPADDQEHGKKDDENAVKTYTIHKQPKNYYKAVSDNKEVSKLQSQLSTAINSTKKVWRPRILNIFCVQILVKLLIFILITNLS